ncbi:MAG: S9 family peptidase [Clostridia bacterium]|nr:S9 family peptidase [Clostridia bacterium]
MSHYVNACHTPAVTTVVSQAFLPQACVLCYPVVSTDPAIAHRNSFKYLLGQFPTDETAADFSTEKLVTANTPPTFIWSTAADENVPVANSLVYAEALARHNVPYEMHIYPCGIHGMSTVDDETNRKVDPLAACNAEWIAHSIRFLKEILKTPKERTL